jgi:hypothetical protein
VSDDIESRLAAVERAVTDGETDLDAAADAAAVEARLADVEEAVSALDDRLSDLEGAVQAVRGYVGSVRQVNEEVERRADAALAETEALRERLDAPYGDGGAPGTDPGRGTGSGTPTRGTDGASSTGTRAIGDGDRPDRVGGAGSDADRRGTDVEGSGPRGGDEPRGCGEGSDSGTVDVPEGAGRSGRRPIRARLRDLL